jgi:hypothetical protein
MPPPATLLSVINHRVSLYRHYFVSWTTLNRQTLLLVIKLLIFLVKSISLTKPCLPVATREGVLYPLMSIAALELAAGVRTSASAVGLLMMVHFGVLLGAARWGGGLCVRRGEWGWAYD